MNLADTRFGEITSAFASAGILTPLSMVIVIFTSPARGSIESILPIGTTTTLTSSPGYRPTAEVKYAITFCPVRLGHTRYAPTISVTTNTQISAVRTQGL